jgi:uncharacterized membrane protein/sporulation protein YlmC with PRC-barrel domain
MSQAITHIVVQVEDLPDPGQRLVPMEQVDLTTSDPIRLRCTKRELADMEPFVEKRYIPKKEQDWEHYQAGEWSEPYASTVGTQYKTEEELLIPKGELAIGRGTRVDATDGHVGIVGELVIDPKTGHISHVVLEESHLLSKHDVAVPVSAIDRVEDDTVYLKLDRHGIETLPAIPIKRHHHEGTDEPETVEMIARVFDSPGKANEALEFVEGLRRRRILKVLNAAVLVKEQDGTTTINDTKDIKPGKGRIIGAITGGLIGLVGGPVGVVVGALVGAGAGGLATRWIDLGFSDEFLAGLEEHLQPGRSALVLLIENHWAHPASEALSDWGGIVLQQTITDELAEELLKASEASA